VGSPAVVVVPALGTSVLEWMHIQRELAPGTRVCVYDRAGIGWSDPPPRGRRTLDSLAAELQQLLTAAEISPPYVLAAHSFGGVVARRFAASNRSAVAGMVLIDSSHEDQARRLQVEKRGHDSLLQALRQRSQMLGLRRLAASAGLIRGLDDASLTREDPPEFTAAARAISLSSRQRRASISELLMIARGHGQPPNLGSLPLTVLTAAGRDRTWMQMQTELAGISTDSNHITASNAGHHIHLDEPDLVVQAIRDLSCAPATKLANSAAVNSGFTAADSVGSPVPCNLRVNVRSPVRRCPKSCAIALVDGPGLWRPLRSTWLPHKAGQ
jgi:pimeloyl-ACP methyl ester carboxylesterase